MTWDGQTRRGQARRTRVILFGLDPFVVMVDGAAGGTYREQSWAEWSKHSTFHDRGGGAAGLVMGVSEKKESIRIWMACPWNPSRPELVQFIPRLQQCAVVGSEPAHDQNTTVDCSFPIPFPQLVAVP